MRKMITLLACLGMVLVFAGFPIFAADPSANVTGPQVVRAGDTIIVAVSMSGTGISAVQGEITYDSAQLTYQSNADTLTGWTIDIDGSAEGTVSFLGIDDKLAAPINSSKQLFTLSFLVKSTAAIGANIRVTADNLSVSDGTNDFEPASVSYSVNVAAPLSNNAFLASMTVSNASVSPAFNKNTTSYSATVPFSVSRLEVLASVEDSKSKVAVSGQNLAVGANTVSVVVTAENGSKKTYSINVTREQDPDYKASGDARLKSISPGAGILSPVFSTDRTLYNVYLPYEITTFDATAEALDPKAGGVEKSAIELIVGENEFTVTGIAEDGTRKVYTIMVFRMPAIGEEMPEATPTLAETPVSEVDGDERFILSGFLMDANNVPLANKLIELNSDGSSVITDGNGFYRLVNVTAGEHTLYVKGSDGALLADVLFTITEGDKTEFIDGELIAEDSVSMNIVLKDSGIEFVDVEKNVVIPADGKNPAGGVPWWGVLLIAFAAAILGFIVRHLTFRGAGGDDGDGSADVFV